MKSVILLIGIVGMASWIVMLTFGMQTLIEEMHGKDVRDKKPHRLVVIAAFILFGPTDDRDEYASIIHLRRSFLSAFSGLAWFLCMSVLIARSIKGLGILRLFQD